MSPQTRACTTSRAAVTQGQSLDGSPHTMTGMAQPNTLTMIATGADPDHGHGSAPPHVAHAVYHGRRTAHGATMAVEVEAEAGVAAVIDL